MQPSAEGGVQGPKTPQKPSHKLYKRYESNINLVLLNISARSGPISFSIMP